MTLFLTFVLSYYLVECTITCNIQKNVTVLLLSQMYSKRLKEINTRLK